MQPENHRRYGAQSRRIDVREELARGGYGAYDSPRYERQTTAASVSVPVSEMTEPTPNGADACREPMVLAMAYVKSQPFRNVYKPEEAWRRGTLFADLDLPYGGQKR